MHICQINKINQVKNWQIIPLINFSNKIRLNNSKFYQIYTDLKNSNLMLLFKLNAINNTTILSYLFIKCLDFYNLIFFKDFQLSQRKRYFPKNEPAIKILIKINQDSHTRPNRKMQCLLAARPSKILKLKYLFKKSQPKFFLISVLLEVEIKIYPQIEIIATELNLTCSKYIKILILQFDQMRNLQIHRKYCKISYQKRLKLIDMVERQKIGVTRAAKKLRIKTATAKVILSSYRKKGLIFRKKKEFATEPAVVPHFQMQKEDKQNGNQWLTQQQPVIGCFQPFYAYYFAAEQHNHELTINFL